MWKGVATVGLPAQKEAVLVGEHKWRLLLAGAGEPQNTDRRCFSIVSHTLLNSLDWATACQCLLRRDADAFFSQSVVELKRICLVVRTHDPVRAGPHPTRQCESSSRRERGRAPQI